ncbi:hypothetical protein AB0442_24330 [Kitasatospora sp. NPDC085895]|uniref:hypothetical protein n=1 Tax=Kitasatospora sp. NPDC085895 TaxID=3155057 RepID=UPI003450C159
MPEIDLAGLTTSGERCIEELSSLFVRSRQGAVKPEWVIVDAATAVETHVSRALSRLVSESGVSDTRLGQALIDSINDDIHRTWASRLDWLGEGFGVSIKGEAFAQDLLVVVDCRNAIVHGSGYLTKQQTNNFTKALALRKRMKSVLDIDTHSTRLVLGELSVERCIRICRRFVVEFDRLVSSLCSDVY